MKAASPRGNGEDLIEGFCGHRCRFLCTLRSPCEEVILTDERKKEVASAMLLTDAKKIKS